MQPTPTVSNNNGMPLKNCNLWFLLLLTAEIQNKIEQIANGTYPGQTEARINGSAKAFASSINTVLEDVNTEGLETREEIWEAREGSHICFYQDEKQAKAQNMFPTAMIIATYPHSDQGKIHRLINYRFKWNNGCLGVIFVLNFKDTKNPNNPLVSVWRSDGSGYPGQPTSHAENEPQFCVYNEHGSQKLRVEGHYPDLVATSATGLTLELKDLVHDDEDRQAVFGPESEIDQKQTDEVARYMQNLIIHIPPERLCELMTKAKVKEIEDTNHSRARRVNEAEDNQVENESGKCESEGEVDDHAESDSGSDDYDRTGLTRTDAELYFRSDEEETSESDL